MFQRGQSPMELYLHNLLANVLGLIAILALNIGTPLTFFRSWRNFIVNESGWKFLLLFIPFILMILVVSQYLVQRPIKKVADLIRKVDVVPEEIEKNGRRRLLNFPFIISFINLSGYLFIPSLYLSAVYLLRGSPFLLVRAVNFLMVGLVVATFSSFLIEDRLPEHHLCLAIFPNHIVVGERPLSPDVVSRMRNTHPFRKHR